MRRVRGIEIFRVGGDEFTEGFVRFVRIEGLFL